MSTQSGEKTYEIPTVSFRVITDDKSLLVPAGVHSEQARTYGYNDFSDFERPEHYIRYIEPIESELAAQVEYDMDEQDQEWLDTVNAERKKDQSGPVSYEVFEIIMDKLEKEWFTLIKRIPQPETNMPDGDSKCAICDDGEGENSNAIVFCDGCNLAVHQDCYGVPYIPEGQWLCRKCTVSPENPVSCLFCPNEGGAFKQTTTGHWAHLLCAIWIPELGVGNAIYMEPVEGVDMVPKSRWKLHCSLCKERVGACIQCENKSCFTAFHVTCARQAGLLMSMKLMGADGQLKAYCEKHLPADWRDMRTIENGDDDEDESYHETSEDDVFEEEDVEEEEEVEATPPPRKRGRPRKNSIRTTSGGDRNRARGRPRGRPPGRPPGQPKKEEEEAQVVVADKKRKVTTKSARAHAKSYRPGPPIVPRMIVNKLLDYISKISIRKKQPFVERLCRYWSLKREARRGAPLLKRLHLEPWTATTESKEQTDAEKAKNLEFLGMLRNDLEKVRLLAELVRKREKEKLRQAQVIKEVVDSFIFPHYDTLRNTFEQIVAMDRGDIFLTPVTLDEAPDYYDVIKAPMCWTQIDTKLKYVKYLNVADFKRDVYLVLDNAMQYNKSETTFHRTASRIKKNAKPLLDALDSIPPTGQLMPPVPEGADAWGQPLEGEVGDIETSLARLQCLIAPDPTEEGRDMLRSIFAFEVEKAPPPPPSPKPKRKALTAAERNKKFEEAAERYKERLSLGGGSARKSRTAAAVVGPESSPPPLPETSGRRRRGQPSADTESTPSSPKASKRQPGVVGVESIPVVSDRERRRAERGLDLIADSLDSKDEYERFNVGWILPEGTKRRRPIPTPSAISVPPPKKRAASSTASDSRSTKRRRTSTSAPADEAPATPAQAPKKPRKGKAKQEAPEEEAAPEPEQQPQPQPEVQVEAEAEPEPEGEADAEGEDEELTPVPDSAVTPNFPRSSLSPPPVDAVDDAASDKTAVDDSSKTAGKADADADAGAAETMDVDPPAEPEPEPEPASAAEKASSPAEKPSSPADDAADDALDATPAKDRRKPAAPVPKKRSPPADGADPYPPGTQVWAKVTSYPYFPGVVVDPAADAALVPEAVAALQAEAERAGRAWLVRFHDKQGSWGWMHAERLEALGEDEEIDKMYLAGRERSRAKGFKSSHLKASCRQAYQKATEAAPAPKAPARVP